MKLTEDSFIRKPKCKEPFYVLVRKKNEDVLVEIEKKDFDKCELLDKTKAIIPTIKIKQKQL